MCRSLLALGGLLPALILAAPKPLGAAELPVRTYRTYAGPAYYCGPCGCLTVRYVYHRILESTYGTGFDPRNYDQTEPHFYFGPVRAFPRYYVDGVPTGGAC
jgi:hypothetical protein